MYILYIYSKNNLSIFQGKFSYSFFQTFYIKAQGPTFRVKTSPKEVAENEIQIEKCIDGGNHEIYLFIQEIVKTILKTRTLTSSKLQAGNFWIKLLNKPKKKKHNAQKSIIF